ncbi:cobalamin biosynthesis protein CobN [Oleispira antarctica]|uniref:Cobalamin biosynthesis protein CobN n=1 Tax=Oleispira antarctica TaxID=188908 RepID=A0A1Y5I3B2_OLEAN|nr:cobalamin biosynthesis protein CobN [Oleispira antarctica]
MLSFSAASIAANNVSSKNTSSKNSVSKNIVAFVSDRSSGSLVVAAHRFLDLNPQHAISIRSVSQINLMSDKELISLVTKADAILMAAVFAEPVERFLNLKYPAQQTRVAINGDRRLLSLNSDPLNQHQTGLFDILSNEQKKSLFKRLTNAEQGSYAKQLADQQKQWPQFSYWLQTKGYWQNRSDENRMGLFTLLASSKQKNSDKYWPELKAAETLRFYLDSKHKKSQQELALLVIEKKKPSVFILDHDTGDRPGDWQLHQELCQQIVEQSNCISVLSAWGEASINAVKAIKAISEQSSQPFLIVSLQDFVVGGGDGRQQVSELFSELNVPVFKGVRVTELNSALYDLSSQGLPADSVHYRIAMPELQGIGQAHVIALAAPTDIDELTGAQVSKTEPVTVEISRLTSRINKWFALQTKANKDKKVAIVFYNHPPGRHNIGADNLNVPESLWHMLNELKQQGYDLGPQDDFPVSAEALLDLLQQKAVNLPEDAKALAGMSGLIHNMTSDSYQTWFKTLPEPVQSEMQQGPLGFMHQRIEHFIFGKGHDYLLGLSQPERQRILTELYEMMDSTMHDLHHALDGIRHKGRERALNLLDQLEEEYVVLIEAQKADINHYKESQKANANWQQAEKLQSAILAMQIEGVRGWGEAPGKTMVWNNKLLIPGIELGNVFLGPQPPRGWELNEELLHANMSFPPPHQYLAFYKYLAKDFSADALVHVGRHSTYEFLPKRGVGLSAMDYPSIVVQDIPSIYPYIVDGVGEGIQAKRRGIAIMVDHLTPPLAITELYDGLLQLRQLIESAEAASDESTQKKAIKALRHKIDVLNLRDELIASMDEELVVRGVGFSDVDDDFLLHEVGHYLTHLQEEFMPLGLHVFGRDWANESIDTMMKSMADGDNLKDQDQGMIRQALTLSPKAEMSAFINALNGGFVAPGKGNDPIRTPEALPTGRNFYALDGSLLPTQLGVEIGQQLAQKARAENKVVLEKNAIAEKEAIILWASDAVRDEGAMIAFGLDMLGVKPVWNSRGIIKSLELLPLDENRSERRDVLFTSSGLFRDLYGSQLELLDKSVLLGLAASRETINQQYPALTLMLIQALKPVADMVEKLEIEAVSGWDNESLEQNLIARNWVYEAKALLIAHPNVDVNVLARQASLRVFGTAPGAYGAGVNRLAERSGAWDDRKQLGKAFIKRMGHAYGVESLGLNSGAGAQNLFTAQLNNVGNTYLGRASNLYGLIDNNDAFDYLGGLNLAIETVTGEQPDSFVISHANNQNLKMDPLQVALLSELRGRFLNRQWIEPLMKEGYAGARTMGSEFVEYLWGWQVTSPEIIQSWVWEEVKSVYVDDSLNVGLDEFLKDSHNVHVQTNILAVMLVAIDKDFWQTDDATKQQLAEAFAKNIIEKGIPGSGHTHANHPVYDFVKPLLDTEQAQKLEQTLAASRMNYQQDVSDQAPVRIQEIDLQNADQNEQQKDQAADEQSSEDISEETESVASDNYLYAVLAFAFLLMLIGFIRARRL